MFIGQTAEPTSHRMTEALQEASFHIEPATLERLVSYEAEPTFNGQRVGIAHLRAAEGHEGDPSIIVTSAFTDSFSMPVNQYRLLGIAQATGAQVLGVDSIGTGKSSSLTNAQKEALAKGSFDPIAERVWGPLLAKGIQTVDIFGYSMGTNLGVALAKTAPAAINLRQLTLWESPSMFPSENWFRTTMAFMAEGANLSYYRAVPEDGTLREITEKDSESLPGFSYRALIKESANRRYFIAMKNGSVEADTEAAMHRHSGLRVVLIDNNHSEISQGYNAAEELLKRQFGERVERYTALGETHALGDSVGSLAAAAGIIYRLPRAKSAVVS